MIPKENEPLCQITARVVELKSQSCETDPKSTVTLRHLVPHPEPRVITEALSRGTRWVRSGNWGGWSPASGSQARSQLLWPATEIKTIFKTGLSSSPSEKGRTESRLEKGRVHKTHILFHGYCERQTRLKWRVSQWVKQNGGTHVIRVVTDIKQNTQSMGKIIINNIYEYV